MVSGICFKTHSRCIHALLVQLTRKFNKNPPCVFGRACTGLGRGWGQNLQLSWLESSAGSPGFACSSTFWVSILLPHNPRSGSPDKRMMVLLQRQEGGRREGLQEQGPSQQG